LSTPRHLWYKKKATATLYSSEAFSYGFIGFISADVQIIVAYWDSGIQAKMRDSAVFVLLPTSSAQNSVNPRLMNKDKISAFSLSPRFARGASQ
jgi:hypothetical protein